MQGSVSKPCIALPTKVNLQQLVALVNVGIQDIPILANPQNQQCTENSTQAKSDQPLTQIAHTTPAP
ncbi:rodlin [Streptomyces altiplanensis]